MTKDEVSKSQWRNRVILLYLSATLEKIFDDENQCLEKSKASIQVKIVLLTFNDEEIFIFQ